jgi:hypothetical protein
MLQQTAGHDSFLGFQARRCPAAAERGRSAAEGFGVEECLAYFRQAIADPRSVPPWSEWWAANTGLIERVFPRLEFVRLKHRRLLGARQILQNAGELPEDSFPPSPLLTGSCGECGDGGPGGGYITCPTCGLVCQYDSRPAPTGEHPDAEPFAAADPPR